MNPIQSGVKDPHLLTPLSSLYYVARGVLFSKHLEIAFIYELIDRIDGIEVYYVSLSNFAERL